MGKGTEESLGKKRTSISCEFRQNSLPYVNRGSIMNALPLLLFALSFHSHTHTHTHTDVMQRLTYSTQTHTDVMERLTNSTQTHADVMEKLSTESGRVGKA